MDKPPLTPEVNREYRRQQLSVPICTELRLAAIKAPPPIARQLLALAGRIQLCNSPEQIWVVKNAYEQANHHQRDAVGKFWRCGSKLCPSCLARQSQLTRAKLREALAAQRPNSGNYYFITFTIPNPDLSLLETRSIVNHAWTLFRKRSLCASLIRGGIKSEEFTVTKNGFHYHLHAIFLMSAWFLYNELRRIWTDCVAESFRSHGREQMWQEHLERRKQTNADWNKANPTDKPKNDLMLLVKIKPIHPTERSIQEVCKYVTKADSWSKMRRQDLIEIALVQRWSRMFELLGTFLPRRYSAEGTAIAIVHTKSFTDGGSEPSRKYWREIIQDLDVEVYLINLEDKINAQIHYGWRDLRQRFPNNTITTLDHLI